VLRIEDEDYTNGSDEWMDPDLTQLTLGVDRDFGESADLQAMADDCVSFPLFHPHY
jgi:hypothetical protein